MNTKSRICFTLYQYWQGGQELTGDFQELRDWSRRSHVTPGPGEWLFTGRLCQRVKVGDTLLTETGREITVKNLWAYGRSFESLSAGMTCGMLVAAEEIPLWRERNLYLG